MKRDAPATRRFRTAVQAELSAHGAANLEELREKRDVEHAAQKTSRPWCPRAKLRTDDGSTVFTWWKRQLWKLISMSTSRSRTSYAAQ